MTTIPCGLTDKSPHIDLVTAFHDTYMDRVAATFDVNRADLRVGVKVTNTDLTTHGGFRWPVVYADQDPVLVESWDNWKEKNDESCPSMVGDGLCVATQAVHLTSGNVTSIGACTGLVLVYQASEARSDTPGKFRVPWVWVVDMFVPAGVIRVLGTGANLAGADLTGADLTGADLTGADLTGADLTGADLTGADLYGAHLYGADLTGADLYGAHLSRAHLTGHETTDLKQRGAIL